MVGPSCFVGLRNLPLRIMDFGFVSFMQIYLSLQEGDHFLAIQ